MKIASIYYFGDVFAVNGINFVTNLFLSGRSVFEDNNVRLDSIYSSNGRILLSTIESINIGQAHNTVSSKRISKLRSILAKVFTSKVFVFAWLKVYLSIIRPARKVATSSSNNIDDIQIFQDIFTAYFCLRKKKTTQKKILILHCSESPFEQLLSYYPSLLNSKFHRWLEIIKEYVYNNVDKVVFLSKNALAHNSHAIPGKATFVYNGIPVRFCKEMTNQSKNTIDVVCVGSMNWHKGQELLVDSLLLLKDKHRDRVHLHLIGSGAQYYELKLYVDSHGLSENVTMYGVRNDVDKLLEQMDIMILPSRSEGMPLSILEGMRQGLYILSTPVGALPEILNSHFGGFISRDSEEIADRLMYLIDNPLVIEKAKVASRLHFQENFTLSRMITRYIEIFNDIYD